METIIKNAVIRGVVEVPSGNSVDISDNTFLV